MYGVENIKNKLDSQSMESLRDASIKGNLPIIEKMIDSKLDLDQSLAEVYHIKTYGYRAIHWAARYGQLDVIKLLVNVGKAQINIKNYGGNTAIHDAISWLQYDTNKRNRVVKCLIHLGADINSLGKHKYTPLHYLICYLSNNNDDDINLIQFLIENGADITNKECGSTPQELADKYGYKKYQEFMQSFMHARDKYQEIIMLYDDKNYNTLIVACDIHNTQLYKRANVYNLKGWALLMIGRAKEAMNHFEIAVKMEPENIVFIYNLAYAYYHLNDVRKAIDLIDKAIKYNKNALLVNIKGLLLINQNTLDKAIDSLEEAIILDNTKMTDLARKLTTMDKIIGLLCANRAKFETFLMHDVLIIAYNYAGFMFECQRKSEVAIRYRKIAANMLLENKVSNIPFYSYVTGDMKYDEEDFKAAISNYEIYINAFSGYAHLNYVFYKCGLAYLKCFNYNKAAECFENALKLSDINSPIYSLLWKYLAEAQCYSKQYEKSLSSHTNSKVDISSLEKNISFLNSTAIVMQKNGNYKDAKKYFKMTLNIDATDNVALCGLIYIYNTECIYSKIAKYYEKLPKNSLSLINDIQLIAAKAYFMLKNFLKSIECYQEAITNKTKLDSESYCFLAESFYLLGKFDKALQFYEQSLSIDSSYKDARIGKAFALCSQSRYAESLQCCNEFLQNEPDNARILACKGRIKYLQQDYPSSVSFLHRAHSFEPKNENILLWFIEVLKISGHNDKALHYSEYLTKLRTSNNSIETNKDVVTLPSIHAIIEFNRNNSECDKILIEALKNGANINERDANGNTALHKAVLYKLENVIKILHDYDILLNDFNSNGDTALHCAISLGSIDIIQSLLRLRPVLDENTCNSQTGETAFHKFIKEYYGQNVVAIFNLFIAAGIDVNCKTKMSGDTPISYAIMCKRIELYPLLLAAKANPSLTNFRGLNCLHQTFIINDLNQFKYFLTQKAKLTEELNEKVIDGFLHLAIKVSSVDKTKEYFNLFKHYRSNITDFWNFLLHVKNAEGLSPIEFALETKQLLFFEYYISMLKSPSNSLNQFNIKGKTLLISAIELGLYKFVQTLLKNGADSRKLSKDGIAPIYFAVLKSQVNVIELLLSLDNASEIVLYKNNREQNLLHIAVLNGTDVEILEMLYQNIGKNERKNWINYRDCNGQTALHLAIIEKRTPIINWILGKEEIDINLTNGKDKGRQTALHLAVQSDQEDIVTKLCRKQDIKFYLRNNQNQAPLFFAKNKNIKRILKFTNINHFYQQLSIHFKSKFKGKDCEYWSSRISAILHAKNESTRKLKEFIMGFEISIVDKIAQSMANMLAEELNSFLAVEAESLKYQELFYNRNFHTIDALLLKILEKAFSAIDTGQYKVSESSVSKSSITNEFDGFIMPRDKLHSLKRKAFIRAICEGLEYQFYICKALQDKLVDRKSDFFDNIGDIVKDISPSVQQSIGSTFNGALVFTFVNIFTSVIKAVKDANARERAKYVTDAYGNGAGSLDKDKLKGVASQLFKRFEILIYNMSVGLDSCGKLHMTPNDGIVCFASAITQRINKHVIEHKSMTELEDGSAIINMTKSARNRLKQLLEKNFFSPQNHSTRNENLYLVDRCIFASWFEDEGEDIEVQLDNKRYGEKCRVKAGNLLRFTGICIEDKRNVFWRHKSTIPELGHIYTTEAEAKSRDYYPGDVNDFKLEYFTPK